jgi:hypothetical protein
MAIAESTGRLSGRRHTEGTIGSRRLRLRRKNAFYSLLGTGFRLVCSARATGNWYPKRLIDVRQGTARLVITQEEELTEPYATLSHCWGKNQPFLVLTASNIRQLSKGIPNDSLPKTFADAIDVTWWLGIGYLWIDSLCIIQSGEGSKDDWLKHATEMASVYQNCVLNISADAGDNPHHGLYSTRNPDLVNELRAQVGRKYAYIWVDGLCGYDALASTPLAKRGWVLQERLLAPRVLHMGVLQIFWECRETDLVCECHPEERPINAWGLGPISPFDITDIYHPVRVGDPPKDETRQNFRRVVEHYTRCDLTFPDTDKLVALAAIAQQATALLKDEYVAGMFRSDLASQLLWQASREAGRARDHYRAPSWSWASIDGPVKLFSPRIESKVKHFAEVQSHQVKLFDAHNPFGGIEAGSKLTILGFLLPLPGVTKGFFTTRGLGFGVTKPPGIAGTVISEGTIKLDDFTPEFLNFEDTDFYLFPVVQDCHDFHCLVLARSAREQGYLRVAHWMSDDFMGRPKAEWLMSGADQTVFDLY